MRGSPEAQLRIPSRSAKGPAHLDGKRDQHPCLAQIQDLRAETLNADIREIAVIHDGNALPVVDLMMMR